MAITATSIEGYALDAKTAIVGSFGRYTVVEHTDMFDRLGVPASDVALASCVRWTSDMTYVPHDLGDVLAFARQWDLARAYAAARTRLDQAETVSAWVAGADFLSQREGVSPEAAEAVGAEVLAAHGAYNRLVDVEIKEVCMAAAQRIVDHLGRDGVDAVRDEEDFL